MLLNNPEMTKEIKKYTEDVPGGPVVKNLHASAGNPGLIPGLGGFCMLQGD